MKLDSDSGLGQTQVMSSLRMIDIMACLERRAPLSAAEPWDNVGLLIGDSQEKLRGVLISVDLSQLVLQRCQDLGLNLIITHHPVIFPNRHQPGLRKVTAEEGPSQLSRLLYECLRQGIAVYTSHTNFDRCALEVVEKVSQGLGLKGIGRFFDPLPLEKSISTQIVSGQGYGFWGDFPQKKTFKEVALNVTKFFNLPGLRFTGDKKSTLKRIGFVAGAASAFLHHAQKVEVDCFISGEISYHLALQAARSGTQVLELGHRESERFFAPVVQGWLSEMNVPVEIMQEATQSLLFQAGHEI